MVYKVRATLSWSYHVWTTKLCCGGNDSWLPWVLKYLGSWSWSEPDTYPRAGNVCDHYAVAVTKPGSSTVVGHVPRKISTICSLFVPKGDSILCEVSGGTRYSQDLPQGGLEIPCLLRFQGVSKDVQKVEKLAILALSSQTSSNPQSPPSLEPPTKKVRVDGKHDMSGNANKENHMQSPELLWQQGNCEAYTKPVFEGWGVQENSSRRNALRHLHVPGTPHSQEPISNFEWVTVNTFGAEDNLSYN